MHTSFWTSLTLPHGITASPSASSSHIGFKDVTSFYIFKSQLKQAQNIFQKYLLEIHLPIILNRNKCIFTFSSVEITGGSKVSSPSCQCFLTNCLIRTAAKYNKVKLYKFPINGRRKINNLLVQILEL